MKIWYVLKWVCQALLAELRKWKGEDMVVTNTFYLTAESYRQWLEANPTAVSVDANNVQKSPLVIRSWSGEGSDKTAYPVYLTLQVESVAGTSTEVLYTYKSSSKVSEYTYTLPSDKYATANRITVSAYDDAARTKAVGSVQLNILADNPVPYPRSEEWSASLTYKNGEYLKVGDVLYMWTSRVPGNTTTDPKTWIQNNPTSKLWTEYPYNTLLAGQILLFEFAKIGQAIFQNQYMISQHGVDADGNESDDYRNFGKIRYNPGTGESQNLFTPNLLFNFLTGAGHLGRKNIEFGADGTVTLKGVKSKNNAFQIDDNGDVTIVGKVSTSAAGARIEIDPATKSISMYNENNDRVFWAYLSQRTTGGGTRYYPLLRMDYYYDGNPGETITISSTSVIMDLEISGDRYRMELDPMFGLTFKKNGSVTKTYPAS